MPSIAASSITGGDELPWRRSFVKTVRVHLETWNRDVEATLLAWPAGRSSTGQAMVEWHTPAGPALAAALLNQMTKAGARLAKPGEFTLRAFLAGKLDLSQAEGVLGLVDPKPLPWPECLLQARTGCRAKGSSHNPITENLTQRRKGAKVKTMLAGRFRFSKRWFGGDRR